ncbi:MAG: hypothetical protein JJLCMIEE_00240 [Acidimicrobiales bacterium]|nr:MAG: hypothetical protein EDR02_01470 [Actinomycetota bacterium]MBV6507199.1 hypothetical protein [Acidimicrobiales bacterium]RIK05514.1 MAG: hypothetical protein DCC48_09460 [Acidobacteriota bacterium]
MDNRWIWAGVAVGVGLLLGAIAGRIVRNALNKEGRPPEVREIAKPVGVFLFWSGTATGIVLAVAISSPETLRPVPTQILSYLPNLLVAGLLLIAGYALAVGLATAVGQAVYRASGVRQRGLERALRLSIMAAAVILSLGQLGVDTTILLIIVVAAVASPAIAAGLLAGLGGRGVAANLAAGRSLRHQLRAGQYLTVGGTSGRIVEIHPVTIELQTAEAGRVHIPHTRLLASEFTLEDSA